MSRRAVEPHGRTKRTVTAVCGFVVPTLSANGTAVTCPSKPSKHTTPTFLKRNFMRCRPLATPRALIATVLSRTRPSRQRQRPRIWESDGRKGERKREACKWTTGSAANGFFTAEHLRIPYPQQCRYSEHSRTAGQSETPHCRYSEHTAPTSSKWDF